MIFLWKMFCPTQGHPRYEGKLDDYLFFLKLYFIITNMNVMTSLFLDVYWITVLILIFMRKKIYGLFSSFKKFHFLSLILAYLFPAIFLRLVIWWAGPWCHRWTRLARISNHSLGATRCMGFSWHLCSGPWSVSWKCLQLCIAFSRTWWTTRPPSSRSFSLCQAPSVSIHKATAFLIRCMPSSVPRILLWFSQNLSGSVACCGSWCWGVFADTLIGSLLDTRWNNQARGVGYSKLNRGSRAWIRVLA